MPSAPPPATEPCAACLQPFSLALNGRDYSGDAPLAPPPLTFAFYNDSALTMLDATPRSGPLAGGTSVTLRGAALTPAGADVTDYRCRFGDAVVHVLSAAPDGSELVCAPTPAFATPADGSSAPWRMRISVAPNRANFVEGRRLLDFLLYLEPAPSMLLPGGGPTDGGTTVRVHVPGFVPGPHTDVALARCRYGRRDNVSVVRVMDLQEGAVTCGPSPATTLYAIGVDKELHIALNGEQFAPHAGVDFRYYVQPQLSSLWPTGGAMAGGTVVTLHGVGFDRFFAGVPPAATARSHPEGRPLCLFGGHCFDADSVHRGLGCNLQSPPHSAVVTATAEQIAVPASLVSNSAMLCRSPEGPQQSGPVRTTRARTSVRVAVALNSQNFVHHRTPLYVFHAGVSATDVQPVTGPPMGGVEVRVNGANLGIFGEAEHARCRFSGWSPLVAGAALGEAAAAAAVTDVRALHKTEDGLVCRTPPRRAGRSELTISINEHDFHGPQGVGQPPLTHTYACEQLSGWPECVTSHSCGFCEDELPAATGQYGHPGLDHSAWGITQDRIGCLQCHEDGCGAGPAEGHCRQWTFETRMLEAPVDAAQAEALHLANVSEPLARSASAWGELLPDQMRYFRIRPERGGLRLQVSLYAREGNLRLYARRGQAPGAAEGEYERVTPHLGTSSSQRLSFSQAELPCVPPAVLSRAEEVLRGEAPAMGTRGPLCEEWVFGVLGTTFFTEHLRPGTVPRADLALFNLTARLEPEVVDFECAECGGDCSACGWSLGNATQLLRDDDGARVARLTNRSGQLGTLWLREPQEVQRGFYARFRFRVSRKTLCLLPLETLGTRRTATVGAGQSFVPVAQLRAAGQDMTHFLADDSMLLPFEPLPAPVGVPEDLHPYIGSLRTEPPALGGTFDVLPVSGIASPFVPGLPAGPDFKDCPQDASAGGEGFAFVLQWDGPTAAGCGGTGLGYAAAAGCEDGGLAQSVAVQFDTHSNLRVERHHGEHRVRAEDRIKYDRRNALSVFTGGRNEAGTSQGMLLLEMPGMVRFDDGLVHEVLLHYTPDGPNGGGQLDITLDRNAQQHPDDVTLSVPLALGEVGPAYVGFTATTSEVASEAHDILSLSFCQNFNCSAD